MHLVKKCLKGILLFSCFIFFPCQADEASNSPVPKDLQELKSVINKKADEEKKQLQEDPDSNPLIVNMYHNQIRLHVKPGEYPNQTADEYMQTHPDIYISDTKPMTAWSPPHISALPPSLNGVLLYTKAFADRFGLNDDGITSLDSGIDAIQVRFYLVYEFNYDAKDPFVQRYHLDKLTSAQRESVNYHLNAFPIIFPGEKMPLKVHYDCDLDLFLNKNDPRVNNLQMPTHDVWWDAEVSDRAIYEMLAPIQEFQVTAPEEPGLQHAAHNQPGQLLANYQDYVVRAMQTPVAVLGKSQSAIYNPDQRTVLSFNSHFTNFLPELTYLSFHVPYCRVLSDKDASSNSWIWIQKKNAEKKYDSDHFYAFALPGVLMNLPEIKEVRVFNAHPPAMPWYKPWDEKKIYFWMSEFY